MQKCICNRGGATEGIKKYPDKYTNFMGADRKETFKLVLEYLKIRNYYK
ncbi:hypothetical protein KK437_10245 [Clostridioides difficile]|nr:hypothetical protein [Clostridioides difficile]